jgi:hypothetical protein
MLFINKFFMVKKQNLLKNLYKKSIFNNIKIFGIVKSNKEKRLRNFYFLKDLKKSQFFLDFKNLKFSKLIFSNNYLNFGEKFDIFLKNINLLNISVNNLYFRPEVSINLNLISLKNLSNNLRFNKFSNNLFIKNKYKKNTTFFNFGFFFFF